MEDKFTISEIKNYIVAQDNLCNIYFNLSAENVIAANHPFCSCEEPIPVSLINLKCIKCEKLILPKMYIDGRPDNKMVEENDWQNRAANE